MTCIIIVSFPCILCVNIHLKSPLSIQCLSVYSLPFIAPSLLFFHGAYKVGKGEQVSLSRDIHCTTRRSTLMY